MNAQRIPKGYKKTEVGVIPEDWEVRQFREIASFYSGGTPPTRIRSYYGGKIPWITSSDINKGFIDSVEGRITEVGLRNSSAKMVSEGTLLLALYGATAGKAAISKIEAAINQAVLAITPTQDDTMFLFYMLSHLKNWIIETYTQGGQPNLSAEIIKSILIPLPPLLEQRAIAAALADVDGLLAALDALIAKKRAVKTAAMQQLLTGKTRLPGFTGEWVTRRLGDVLKLQYGRSQKGISVKNGVYPILATSGIVGRTNQFLYDKPSIVIGRKGTIDEPIYIDTPFWAIDTTFYAIILEDNSPKFLYYLLSTINWQSYNEASGVPSLNANTVQNIELFLPPMLDEQRAIAAVLSDMDAEIAALEARREKVRQIKQGMMQVLLTGKVRLVKPAARN